MSGEKAQTLRLPLDLATDLVMVATVDGCTQTDAIRQAIESHVAARRADPDFRERAVAMAEQLRALVRDAS